MVERPGSRGGMEAPFLDTDVSEDALVAVFKEEDGA